MASLRREQMNSVKQSLFIKLDHISACGLSLSALVRWPGTDVIIVGNVHSLNFEGQRCIGILFDVSSIAKIRIVHALAEYSSIKTISHNFLELYPDVAPIVPYFCPLCLLWSCGHCGNSTWQRQRGHNRYDGVLSAICKSTFLRRRLRRRLWWKS